MKLLWCRFQWNQCVYSASNFSMFNEWILCASNGLYKFNEWFLISANNFYIQQEIFIFAHLRFIFSNMRYLSSTLRIVFNKMKFIQSKAFTFGKQNLDVTKAYIQKHSTEQKIWSVSWRLKVYSPCFWNLLRKRLSRNSVRLFNALLVTDLMTYVKNTSRIRVIQYFYN